MNADCIKEQLEKQIFLAEKITGKNQGLPILKCLLIETSKGGIKIRSTNLELGIEAAVPAKVVSEGAVAVPGDVLLSFITNSTGKNIHLETNQENLIVTCGQNKTTIKTYSKDDFPIIPKIEPIISFSIKPSELIKGFKAVWYSASNSAIKPELSSVYVAEDNESIVFAATDSFRLAEKKVIVKKLPQIEPLLIPAKNVTEIIRLLETEQDDIKVQLNKNQISFVSESVYLTSRLIEGNFPDYKQIIPKEFILDIVVLKQDLINALKVSTAFSGKSNQVTFSIDTKKKTFSIFTKNTDVGESVAQLAATLEGEGTEINFNHKYIVDCLNSISSDSISISIAGPQRPMVIKPIGDNSFTYLVMPMKG